MSDPKDEGAPGPPEAPARADEDEAVTVHDVVKTNIGVLGAASRTMVDMNNSEVEIGGKRAAAPSHVLTKREEPAALPPAPGQGAQSKQTRPVPGVAATTGGAGGQGDKGTGDDPHDDARVDLEAKIAERIAAAQMLPRTDPFLGREVGGRFTIMNKVGEGGMGAVYRARQRGMDRDVAVKVLLGDVAMNETVVKRFQLEALAVSKLRSPHTIQIYDFGETDDGQLYIAMEFLEGQSLHELLEADKVLSARRALRIAQAMLRSLREAHGKGIVHRDLKPDNVFLTSLGEESDYVKVLDFGVAKLREGDPNAGTVTKTGTIFGTPKYMSPEQSRGKHVDHRSDLYAMGVMLYEMLTGRVPFDADNSLGILIKHIQEPPPPIEEVRPDLVVPVEVRDYIHHLLEKHPEKRPQTAEAVLRELEGLEGDLDDIFRNVVTTEEAVAIGLEMATSSKTRADTSLDADNEQLLPTLGPFRDGTLSLEDAERELAGEPRRHRAPLSLVLAGALLLLTMGSLGALAASLEPLPEAWRGLPGLVEATSTVGTVPAFAADDVYVTIAVDPPDAEIWHRGKELEDSSPLTLKRRKGSDSETYTFKKEGFAPLTRTVAFVQTQKETVSLTKLKPDPPPARPPPTSGGTRKGSEKATKTTTSIEPEKVKPTKPLEFKPSKVKETKGAFGSSGSGGKKPSPF